MNKKWLNNLVDPNSFNRFKLEVFVSDGDNIIEGNLISRDRLQKFPIKDGIPRIVAEDFYNGVCREDTGIVQTGKSFGNK